MELSITKDSPFRILKALTLQELQRIEPGTAVAGGVPGGICPLGQALGLGHSPTSGEAADLAGGRFTAHEALAFMCWWDTAVLRESARHRLLVETLAILEEKRGLP